MSVARHHAEWLSLVEVSGPFLSLPVLMRAFSSGLDKALDESELMRKVRLGHEEWESSQEKVVPDPAVHQAWIKFVLNEVLELGEDVLVEGQKIPQSLVCHAPLHGESLRPGMVVVTPQGRPDADKVRMLIQSYPAAQDLEKPVTGKPWKVSPGTRMMELCHATGIRLGLVTNGDRWMLVDAPRNETTGFASWYADLWLEEPVTLRAFRSLLHIERFFNVPDNGTLEALLTESASNQQEVTDQLGYQVRNAVETLIQSLDHADQESSRKLLGDVSETEHYEAALNVMMRLVFLFCAEERKLIPSIPDDPRYFENYAVSTLRERLRETADQQGEEILERRHDAWCRLLATFRAVHGGIEHDRLSLPGYGGHLFDPDRFPFLEGRKRNTHWRETAADPLPVNNRTVLHLLEALQTLELKIPGSQEKTRRRLSFLALGIEQIGNVYEGLLDHTAKRATEPVLGLAGTRNKEPEIPLAKLEELSGEWCVASGEAGEGGSVAGGGKETNEPPAKLLDFLEAQTGRSRSALKKALLGSDLSDSRHSPPATHHHFLPACGNDERLWQRVKPFAGLVRNDSFDYPVVIPHGSVFVTSGTDRRSSGTHYTPRSLTEPIVRYTLEPLVYIGPAEGKPENEWKLRSAKELLDLKICDMACGSGAFLVQACRFLAALVVEAWEQAELRVVSGEWRENEREGHNDCAALPTTEGLADGDGSGGGVLPRDEGLSEGRALRNDQPDSSRGGVGSGQHRGGTGPAAHQGVSPIPQHSAGIADGSGNASALEPTSGPASAGRSRQTPESGGSDQSNAVGPAASPRSKALNPRHSPHTTRHSLRITPFGEPATGKPNEQLIPKDVDERLIYAMRIVAQRCLYGVDKNPLAVEMAKLSLWLLTLAKDKPFEFLDHAIRGGDSLVGIHDMEQLRKFDLDVKGEQGRVVLQFLDRETKDAIALRREIAALPANTVEDVERQEKLLAEVKERMARLRCAADLLIGAEFITPDMSELLKEELDDESDDDDDARGPQWMKSKKASERFRRAARTRAAIDVAIHYQDSPLHEFQSVASTWLCGQTPFHWLLEFPEVIIERGGFDAFVGNPPFMGGKIISTSCGPEYALWLRSFFQDAKNTADLCAYFFQRAFHLLCDSGCSGLLATNTLGQGDTADAALRVPIEHGATLFRAMSSFTWPGQAHVFAALAMLRNGPFLGTLSLDGMSVKSISHRLAVEDDASDVHTLVSQPTVAYVGSFVRGDGFILSKSDAALLCKSSASSAEVIFPYLNGEDLNSHVECEAKRCIINFFDWSIEKARRYESPFAIADEKVRPFRQTVKEKAARERWWQYAGLKNELYESLRTLPTVLVRARVSNTHAIVAVTARQVFADQIVVFATNSWGVFAVLQSSPHEAWSRHYGSTLKSDQRYSPTDCFDTFAFPCRFAHLAKQGENYHEHRRQMMLTRQEGQTKIYNRFHDSDETSVDVQKLRQLHVEMDNAVSAAYGWTDLDLGHDFHEAKQDVRYTISEAARREVLARLLKLNHERYAEEVAQGLHDKKKQKAATAAAAAERKKNAEPPKVVERGLFDDLDDLDTAFPQTVREKLLCAVYLDLVENQPGLRKSAYFDAILLAISPQRCEPMLTGPDRTSFRRAIKRIPAELTAASEVGVPWSDLVTTLTGNKSLVSSADGIFSLGTNFSDVRSSYPSLTPAFVQLLGIAASRLRELQDSTTPADESVAQVVREVNELRPIELRRAVTV